MLKKILVAVIAVVAIFAIYVSTRPATYRVERSIVVQAPAAAVYGQVVDFRKWPDWSPWAHLDPAMKVDFTGPDAAPGSVYHWKGNDKVGEGRMTITGAKPDQVVDIRLEFIKPWEQSSLTEFTFAPDGAGTRVTWSMSGDQDFVGKLFSVFVDMDKMVGPDFEKGLASLKRLAEGKPSP
jgi:hypothetical protein